MHRTLVVLSRVLLAIWLPACDCSSHGDKPLEEPIAEGSDAALPRDGGGGGDATPDPSDGGALPLPTIDAGTAGQDGGLDATAPEAGSAVDSGEDSNDSSDSSDSGDSSAADAGEPQPCALEPGSFDWVQIGYGDYDSAVWADDLAAHGNGHASIAGAFIGHATFGGPLDGVTLESKGERDAYVASYAANGKYLWVAHIESELAADANAITALADGSLVVVGDFQGGGTFGRGQPREVAIDVPNSADSFVARYTDEGELAWVAHIDAGNVSAYVIAMDVVAGHDGSVLVSGELNRDVTFGRGEPNETTLHGPSNGVSRFLARYGADGRLLSVRFFIGDQIAVHSDGSTYVLGRFSETLTLGEGEPHETTLTPRGADTFLARYDAAGHVVWARQASSSSSLGARDMSVSADGSVTVGGLFRVTARFAEGEPQATTLSTDPERLEGFVAHYSATGVLAWATRLGSTGNDVVEAVGATPAGTVLVAGRFEGAVAFGAGQVNELTLQATGMYPYSDLFVAEYGQDGVLRWARGAGSDWTDAVRGIAAAHDGAALVGGIMASAVQPQLVTTTFGPGTPHETVLMTRSSAAYLARYGVCPFGGD
jgi:hypothetical protein